MKEKIKFIICLIIGILVSSFVLKIILTLFWLVVGVGVGLILYGLLKANSEIQRWRK